MPQSIALNKNKTPFTHNKTETKKKRSTLHQLLFCTTNSTTSLSLFSSSHIKPPRKATPLASTVNHQQP